MRTLTEADKQYADTRRNAAYWYAAGYADATGEQDVSMEFGEYARGQAVQYREERVTFLPSIIDQWRIFREEHA